MVGILAFGGLSSLATGQDGGCSTLTLLSRTVTGVRYSRIDIDDGWIAASESGTFVQLFSIDDPGSPELVSSFHTPDTIFDLSITYPRAAAVSGADLLVFDISSPSTPREAFRVVSPPAVNIYKVLFQGDLLYYGDDRGMFILDITDIDDPVELGMFPVPYCTDIVVRGGIAYCISTPHHDAELFILDISDPTAIEEVSSLIVPGAFPNQLSIVGDTAYLGMIVNDVQVVDISDPFHPAIIATILNYTSAGHTAAAGDSLFLSEDEFGLSVYDVSLPAEPRWIETLNPPMHPWEIASTSSLLAVADRVRGFDIYAIQQCSRCTSDWNGPYDRLDYFDVQAFLNAFVREDRAADLNTDVRWDALDVIRYIDHYVEGCP